MIADPTEFGDRATPTRAGARSPYPAPRDSLNRRMPLGTFVHARSGDKGGDANLGLWVAPSDEARRRRRRYRARVTWLIEADHAREVRELVPEAADLEVEVYALPNLGGVNVVIHGLLGQGVAASTRFDPQAKGLGEWVRSRIVHIQEDCCDHRAGAREGRARPVARGDRASPATEGRGRDGRVEIR